jgi:NDP-sugar pyrophosphorylase family protein
MLSINTTTVLLAGGFGTRIKHLLSELPKPLAPVAGRPFLDWVIHYLKQQGVTRVVLSTGYQGQMIEQHYAHDPIPGMDVSCRHEATPMGTAGGFLNSLAGKRTPSSRWLVSNGDSLVLADLNAFCQSLEDRGCPAGILGVRMDDAARYGTIKASPDGSLVAFDEKRPGAGLINAGVYFFRDEIVSLFPEKPVLSFETDVFPHLLARGVRIGVYEASAPFIDIGTPDSLAAATAFIQQHRSSFGPNS